MLKKFLVVFACFFFLSSALLAMYDYQVKSHVPNQIVVKFKSMHKSPVYSFLADYEFMELAATTDSEVHLLSFSSKRNIMEVIETLVSSGLVEYIYPNYVYTILSVPNDPMFANLWGMENTGQVVKIKDRQTGQEKEYKGVPGADIGAIKAWDISTGSKDVTVAVIDTGVKYDHPDLAANIWVNADEIAGNGKDDDGNGYIDDIRGWDFGSGSATPIPIPGQPGEGGSGDNDPMDAHIHGSHVAGTIGAVGNNGIGVAGVNWNVSIMPVKFMNEQGQATLYAAIDAIKYAANNGAKVISASWGGPQSAQPLEDAINEAISKGVLFVAAAGNDSANNDSTGSFPANYKSPGLISIAASQNDDALAFFSNYGKTSVDVAAPGLGIFSTSPKHPDFGNADYISISGTSMATPHVSGLAALVLSKNPALTNIQVKSIIMASVDKKEGLAGKIVTGGRINAYKALKIVADNELYVAPNSIELKPNDSYQFNAYGGSGNGYTWTSSNPTAATVDASGNLQAKALGTTVITVKDSAGNIATSSDITIENGSNGTPTEDCPPGTIPLPIPGMGTICIPIEE